MFVMQHMACSSNLCMSAEQSTLLAHLVQAAMKHKACIASATHHIGSALAVAECVELDVSLQMCPSDVNLPQPYRVTQLKHLH